MTPQPTLVVNAGYSFYTGLEYGQVASGDSPYYSATEDGIDTVDAIASSFPSVALPHGGTAAEDWQISAQLQHFDLFAQSAGYGIDDPIQEADDGYSNVTVAVQSIFTDYITNNSDVPKTVLFTYTLHAVGLEGDLEESGCAWQVYPYPNPGGTLVGNAGTIDFIPSNGAGTATYSATIAPGETVSWYTNYQFEGEAGWAYDPPPYGGGFTGSPFAYDASSTGIIHADELDSKGDPVAGNPDLTFASGIDFSTPACFAAGTRILTPCGEVPVEALRIGERIVTRRGAHQPVVWLGHRRIDCRRHPRPHEVWPVRVATGAFAPGVPGRALLLSPDHAVFVDGALIPVRCLVNGRTVAQVEVNRITYWHVELARHDVLLAEGLPCESYLDTGNRGAFDNGGEKVGRRQIYQSSSAETARAPVLSAAHAAAARPASVIGLSQ